MIYFIGIGGLGMSALAGTFHDLGIKIAGSDAKESSVVQRLRDLDIPVYVPQNKGNIQKVLNDLGPIKFAIATTAIPKDNPEIIELVKNNIPILTYPQALGVLTYMMHTIGISGTHGKTTTTAMSTQIFIENGYNPYAIVTAFFDFIGGKNFRIADTPGGIDSSIGKDLLESIIFKDNIFFDYSRYITDFIEVKKIKKLDYLLIIESDEYRNAFLNYDIEYVAIPAIEYDHLDFFRTPENYRVSFAKMLSNVKRSAIINLKDENVQKTLKILKDNGWHVPKLVDWTINKEKVKDLVYMPAKFLIEDAATAYTLAEEVGIPPRGILRSIRNFKGVWRRFEKLHCPKPLNKGLNTTIISDYAHNPRKIEYAIEALDKYCTKLKIKKDSKNCKTLIIFQPHQYYRLYSLKKEFVDMFSRVLDRFNSDVELWVVDVYSARSSEADKKLINSRVFADMLDKVTKVKVRYSGDLESTINSLKERVNKYDVVLALSAGDMDRYIRQNLCK